MGPVYTTHKYKFNYYSDVALLLRRLYFDLYLRLYLYIFHLYLYPQTNPNLTTTLSSWCSTTPTPVPTSQAARVFPLSGPGQLTWADKVKYKSQKPGTTFQNKIRYNKGMKRTRCWYKLGKVKYTSHKNLGGNFIAKILNWNSQLRLNNWAIVWGMFGSVCIVMCFLVLSGIAMHCLACYGIVWHCLKDVWECPGGLCWRVCLEDGWWCRGDGKRCLGIG